ncbi:MAG: thermonuclease family protein [Nanoarchaeota archaeon]
MKLTKKETFILTSLIILLIAINYSWLDSLVIDSFSDDEFVKVDRIIDGDTLVLNNGNHVRMLGINTPEKKEKYYQEAKDSLNEKILNKTVRLEYGKDKKDKYNRTLAYVFLNNENINLKQVENGLANYYFPSGKDIYYNEFKTSWENCIKSNKNLCEKSENICSKCIELKEFNYNSQEVVFYNSCNYDCNLNSWKIKDEGRKNFIFPNFVLEKEKEIKIKVGEGINNEEVLFWKGEEYVWTKTGDTLFLRDSEGKLVLWRAY